MFNQEDLDEINPSTESVAFDTLLQAYEIRMTPTCLFQSGQRSRKSFGACKTCTHVSYQQISILTLNFNTSFVGHLTNVATLEYFTLTVFFSVFVERCSRVWLGCIERYTWLAVLTRTHVFPGHGMFFFWIPRKLSCPWYRCCLVDSGGNLLNTWL